MSRPFSGEGAIATSRIVANEVSSGDFNSATGRIAIVDSSPFYNDEFTYLAKIRPINDGTNRVIVGWSGNSNPQFSLGTANTLRLVKQNVAAIGATTRTLLTGIWYTVAVTYAANGDWKLYVGQGDALPTLAASGNATQTWNFGTSTMYIGNVVGFGQAFRGLGRQFKFFDRALDLDEVRQATMENSYNTLDGCVGLFELNEGSGTTALDTLGNNTGTLTNVAYSTTVLTPVRTSV